MELKHIEGAKIYITNEGKICIKQYSFEFGKNVYVYLTFDQFMDVASFVVENKDEIDSLWNNGVEVEDDSEA